MSSIGDARYVRLGIHDLHVGLELYVGRRNGAGRLCVGTSAVLDGRICVFDLADGRLTLLFAIAGGAAVGNLYGAQPLLDFIARDLRTDTAVAGALVMPTPTGVPAIGALGTADATEFTARGCDSSISAISSRPIPSNANASLTT